MKNLRDRIIVFGLLPFFVFGCSLADRINKEVSKNKTPQTLNSTDNNIQITVPGNWQKRTDLHDDAELQAANLMGEQYVIILRESKADFGKAFNLDSLTKIARDNLKTAAKDTFFTEPVAVKINGYDAKQFEAGGEIENIKIKYLYAIVETPNNYYQIITWTMNSRFEKNKGILSEVIYSFKEIGSGNSVSPANFNTNLNIKN